MQSRSTLPLGGNDYVTVCPNTCTGLYPDSGL